MSQQENQLSHNLEVAIGKGRELAIKLAEREKHFQQQFATVTKGEKEYEEEKLRLENTMLEFNAKKQALHKKIEQRKKDYAAVSLAVAKLEHTDQSFSINRAAAFVPTKCIDSLAIAMKQDLVERRQRELFDEAERKKLEQEKEHEDEEEAPDSS